MSKMDEVGMFARFSFKKLGEYLGVTLFIGTVGTSLYFCDKANMIKPNLIKQISQAIDINNDEITTKYEWFEAYKKAGIHYDELNPVEPRDLSIPQLEKMLEQYK